MLLLLLTRLRPVVYLSHFRRHNRSETILDNASNNAGNDYCFSKHANGQMHFIGRVDLFIVVRTRPFAQHTRRHWNKAGGI